MIELSKIPKIIDHTNLKSETEDGIRKTCQEAKQYGFRGVCVFPKWTKLVSEELKDTGIKVVILIDPPIGDSPTEKKIEESLRVKEDGASEIDVVMNIPLFKHEKFDQVLEDLKQITKILPTKVIIGSGLDDYPELWERLSRLGNLCGNDPKILARVRDRPFLYEKAEEIGLKHPSIWSVTSEQALEKYKGDIDLPLVVKAARGGGGTHTKLCKTWEEVTRTVKDYLEVAPTCYLLEYIAGTPASVSIIANQEGCKVVAWNQQLIGCSFAAAPTPFTYVGNLTPLKIPKQIEPIIRRKFESLGHQLQLRGNNGFDFILTNKNEIYLLELNPRIQGSLEPIELATQQSLIQMHLDAFTGKLPLSLSLIHI